MKGIITTVVVIGVIGAAGVYLWKKAHTVTETREITEEEFDQMWENWAKEVDKQ